MASVITSKFFSNHISLQKCSCFFNKKNCLNYKALNSNILVIYKLIRSNDYNIRSSLEEIHDYNITILDSKNNDLIKKYDLILKNQTQLIKLLDEINQNI